MLLLAQAWSLHHAASTTHVVCDEHGEPTHLEGTAALVAHATHLARHAAGQPHEEPRLGHDDRDDAAAHDHCVLVELQREQLALAARPAALVVQPPPAVVVRGEPRRSPPWACAILPESARGPPASSRT